MGLDAHVGCDCFEMGRLRVAPPEGVRVEVGEDGRVTIPNVTPLELAMRYDEWVIDSCEHRSHELMHRRLGNIAAIGAVRAFLSPHASRVPILVNKVVYS